MMTQSSRSSFADAQRSSFSPRNSRGSFEFSGDGGGGTRRTSDAHAHRLPSHADDRRNSSASSGVFYHQSHATDAVSGSSSYGGSFAGSVNGSGSVTRDLYSGSRSLSIEEEAAAPSTNNEDQVYSNHSETISPPPENGASSSVSHRGSSDAYDVSGRSTLGSSSVAGLNHRGFDATQSSRASRGQQKQPNANYYGYNRSESSYGETASKQPQQPPAPPPKPGPQEIYQLMKPPPSTEGGEYAGSEIYRSSNSVDLETPTSVKELARMLQCSLEK